VSHNSARPTPRCASYTALLPLLNSDALTPDEAAATREHLAGCAWCRGELAGYEQLEAAARRTYGVEAATRSPDIPLRLEDIMRTATQREHTGPHKAGLFDGDGCGSGTTDPHAPRPRRRGPPRVPALGAIAAVLLVIVLAGLIFSSRGSRIGTSTVPPTATPTLAVGGDTIVFVDGTPWGVLTIDGHQITALPDPWNPVTLDRGHHQVIYVAPPFPALRCTISVPASQSDTCPLTTLSGVYTAPANPDAAPGTPLPSYADATRFIDLGASPRNLSTHLLTALIAATQQALDAYTSTATLEPGDHYAMANGSVAVASTAFGVTLSFVLPTSQETPRSIPCNPFCVGAGGTPSLVAGWHLTIYPMMQWRYTPPGSATITSRQGPSAGSNVDISVNWINSTWRVAVSPQMPNSAALEDALLLLPNPATPGGSYGTVGAALATPLAAGSAFLAFGGAIDQAHAGIVFYHNGVVLAANSAARQLFPSMAVASPREAALAAQLAQALPR
jgi:hypothetical protein